MSETTYGPWPVEDHVIELPLQAYPPEIARIRLPIPMTQDEWANLQNILLAMKPGLVEPEALR